MTLLRWIGQQRTRAIVAVLVLAILTPQIGAHLKSYVTPTVVCLLIIAFLRIDIAACKSHLRRPLLVVSATLWTMLAVPVLTILGAKLIGLDSASNGVFTGLMLQAVASPMMAAPAIVAILGLDATLILITLLCSTALVPLTSPILVAWLDLDVSLPPAALGLKLFLILSGSATAGFVLRRLFSANQIAKRRDEIDGINIIILFIFASAIMTEVAAEFINAPVRMIGLIALTMTYSGLLVILTFAVFWFAGPNHALAISLMTSQRNMGLMLAGAGGAVPALAWLYIAAAQFPIHLLPSALLPLANRMSRSRSDPP